MEQLTDLKAILHSKRANIYYLDKCRVMQKDGRVLYLTEEKIEKQYWNIPIANTICILLGTGTSITQAAVRMLASSGVLIGFSGSGGTPLIAANEVEWLSPQSEYRPTEYIQNWMSFWFDDQKRLKAAKRIQQLRLNYMHKVWGKDKDLKAEGFTLDDQDIERARTHSLFLKNRTKPQRHPATINRSPTYQKPIQNSRQSHQAKRLCTRPRKRRRCQRLPKSR